MDPRRLALDVLEAVDGGARSDAALGRALATAGMAAADRALATRLVYGVLAWRLRLDYAIAAYSNRDLAEIDRPILNVLRLGCYQLFHLDRVPAYAAVDSSVALARRCHSGAAGFVNAVLRRAGRAGEPEINARTASERIAIELSHPTWLVDLWMEELGEPEARGLMRADNEAAPNILRALVDRDVALASLRERGIECEPARYAPAAIRADTAISIPDIVIPQGEASQLIACLLAPRPGERVLDACAAPGGKTAYIAAMLGDGGDVSAVDPGPHAAERIGALLRVAGVTARVLETGIETLAVDEGYDAVLVDAPCAGLGTLREHPEIRWRRTRRDLDDFSRKQRAILAAAARHVRVGGRIVYATCSLSHVENDDVAADFLRSSPGFTPDDPASAPECLRSLLDAESRLRTFPHLHDMAGFFAQRFVRRR